MTDGPLRPGLELGGRYRLEARVDLSVLPDVWRATRSGTDQDVLCAVLPVERYGAAALQRVMSEGPFIQEARHARMVGILDLGADAVGVYAVSGWFGDDVLSARLARGGAMNQHAGAPLVVDVLTALNALHARGLSHRSVNPRDVLMTVGEDGRLRARLLAMSALRALAEDGPPRVSKRTADPFSAPRWMSPEQLRGEAATAESDVWAVGLLLHLVLTGQHPFAGETDAEVCEAMVEGQPEVSPRLPRDVAAVVSQALAKRPGGRFPDADAMRVALERAVVDSDALGPRLSSRAPQRATERPPSAVQVPDDFDLDALISDVRASATSVPSEAPPSAAVDDPRRTAINGSLPAPPGSVPPPPTPSSRAPASVGPAESFDLDSIPPSSKFPPPVAPSQRPLPSLAPEVTRESVTHTALEVKVVDRTHAPRMKRSRPLNAAAALLGVVAVTAGLGYLGWTIVGDRPPPRIPRELLEGPSAPTPATTPDARPAVDAEAPVAGPRPEMQTPVDLGEQVRIPMPEGVTGGGASANDAQPPLVARAQRRGHDPRLRHLRRGEGVPAPRRRRRAATVHRRAGALREPGPRAGARPRRRRPRRRGGRRRAPRGAPGDRLAARGRVLRRLALLGAWGVAAGLRFGQGAQSEPGVVVFVSPENGTPGLVGLALRTGRAVWRSDLAVRPAEPKDYGLSVGPDADEDGVADVVAGTLRDGRRCALLLSGATGLARWAAPRCYDGARRGPFRAYCRRRRRRRGRRGGGLRGRRARAGALRGATGESSG
ncbi:MAG: protein kinase [Polyangiales bacterium]